MENNTIHSAISTSFSSIFEPVHGKIGEQTCENTMNKHPLPEGIKEVPTFFEAPKKETTEVTEDVKASFYRQSELAQVRALYVSSILEEADGMGISYAEGVQHTDGFHDLLTQMSDYEHLMREADDRNIPWSMEEYDPQQLEELIEQYDEDESQAGSESSFAYYNALGLEA